MFQEAKKESDDSTASRKTCLKGGGFLCGDCVHCEDVVDIDEPLITSVFCCVKGKYARPQKKCESQIKPKKQRLSAAA